MESCTNTKRYSPILQALSEFCDREGLTPATKTTHVGDANRILESIIAGLSEEEILDLMARRGFAIEKSSYPSVIRILKGLIEERPR
jgi:hypothetical protein